MVTCFDIGYMNAELSAHCPCWRSLMLPFNTQGQISGIVTKGQSTYKYITLEQHAACLRFPLLKISTHYALVKMVTSNG